MVISYPDCIDIVGVESERTLSFEIRFEPPTDLGEAFVDWMARNDVEGARDWRNLEAKR